MRRSRRENPKTGAGKRGGRWRWRRWISGALAVCALLVIAVVASGWFTRTERFDNGAIVVRSQPGTDVRSRLAARTGAQLALRWFDQTYDHVLRDPVEIRLANRGRCLWIESLDSTGWSGTDLTGDDFVCIYTRRPRWRGFLAEEPDRAVELIAHETIHHAQRALGCIDEPGGFRFQWFVEGMASWAASEALVAGDVWTRSEADRYAQQDAGRQLPRQPLRDFESSDEPGAYSLGRRAIDDLVNRRSKRDLWRFCAEVGRGTAWQGAFRSTFGIAVDDFYDEFDLSIRTAARSAASPSHRSGHSATRGCSWAVRPPRGDLPPHAPILLRPGAVSKTRPYP